MGVPRFDPAHHQVIAKPVEAGQRRHDAIDVRHQPSDHRRHLLPA
jgi:hypothetical protein